MEQKLREVGGPIRVPSGTAPGYRDTGSGRLGNVGGYGFNYSSAFSGTGSVFLHFSTQYFNPFSVGYRGHGFPLRCLSE